MFGCGNKGHLFVYAKYEGKIEKWVGFCKFIIFLFAWFFFNQSKYFGWFLIHSMVDRKPSSNPTVSLHPREAIASQLMW